MPKKGENIYKRKDNRWEARYPKGFTLEGKIHYGYCYGKSYREVKEKLNLAKAAMLSNNVQPHTNSRKRFACYCDEWLRLNRNKVKESTLVKYIANIENHIKPKLGGYYVQALSSLVVEEFAHELLKKLAPKTVKDILTLLKSILIYTAKQVPNMQTIEICYPKDARKEMRVLDKEEQYRLIHYLLQDMNECKFGVLLVLFTGLRIGELCALKWSDISFKNRTISISSTMQRIKNLDATQKNKTKVIITDPKSDTSIRTIPLTEYAAELCKHWSKQSSAAFVLTGTSDRFVEPRTLQYRFQKYMKDCKLEDVTFHTLRHTFATRCVEVDFEIKSLSEILGHSSPKITLERYVHSSMELKRSNMDKLSMLGY